MALLQVVQKCSHTIVYAPPFERPALVEHNLHTTGCEIPPVGGALNPDPRL